MIAAVRRREQMEQQNKLLHEQLEKLASQLPTGGDLVYPTPPSAPTHRPIGGSMGILCGDAMDPKTQCTIFACPEISIFRQISSSMSILCENAMNPKTQ